MSQLARVLADTFPQSAGGLLARTVAQLEAKHGRPISQIVGHVYVLHFRQPTAIRSVSNDYAVIPDDKGGYTSRPLTHYVGWTQQARPNKRIAAHGPGSVGAVVSCVRGTLADEDAMKREGVCPMCGAGLRP